MSITCVCVYACVINAGVCMYKKESTHVEIKKGPAQSYTLHFELDENSL